MLEALANLAHVAVKLREHLAKQELAQAKATVAAEVVSKWVRLALAEYYRKRPPTLPSFFLCEQATRAVHLVDGTGRVVGTTTEISRLERIVVESIEHALALDGLQAGRRFRNYVVSFDFLLALNDAVPRIGPGETGPDFIARGAEGVRQLITRELS
jgi:hypothetical protein